jgi:hypothetical protein
MKEKIIWLRVSYWVGAVADGFFAAAMLHPPILQGVLGLPEAEMGVETRSALATGAALMFGWTCLLLWANARPFERKGILILTVVPVILGLALATLYGFMENYIPLRGALSVWVFQGVLSSLFLFSYFHASAGEAR